MLRRIALVLSLLPASVVFAGSGSVPFNLEAGDVAFDATGKTVTAKGGAVVTTSDSMLSAETLAYDTISGTLTATGKVTLSDAASQTLHVDALTVSSDLTKGHATSLSLDVPELGNIASARTATLTGTPAEGRKVVMEDVTYSPCKTCEGETKPWDLRANTVTYDQSASTLTYRNAIMDVYGTPVMVLPWLRHSVGPKKAQDGLLVPMFGRSESNGEELTISAYHFSPSENADYTLRNRLMSERGDLVSLERRQMGLDHESEIRLSYLNDRAIGKVRSSADVEGEYSLTASRRLGLNAEVASDDTYLQQFQHRLDPYLASTAYAEDASDQHYAGLSLTHFQDLEITHSPANTAQVLPHIQLERWFDIGGGQLTLNGDMVNLQRGSGVQSRRVVTSADFERPFLLEDGSKLTLGGQGRLDLYNVDRHTSGNNSAITRALPQATLDWEKPYISPEGTHTVAPKVLLAISPRGGNVNDKIPNEDSVAYELDTTNLFEPSRFAGLDRVETGPRLVYGLDNRWGTPDSTRWRVFVGQSLRRFTDTTLPASGGASTNASDWVGQIEADPVDWFNINSSFRLDNATFIARRMDSGMRIGRLKGTYAQFTHTYLDGGPQEVDGNFNLPINTNWAFKADIKNDLANDKLLQAQGILAWSRDCYQVELVARRRGYTNGDLRPSMDYLINFQLLTLGKSE